MDDKDIDPVLLRQFGSLGTQDRDVLIAEFRKLLDGNHLSEIACAFYLDMANWNLQDAVCSYLEYSFKDAATTPVLEMKVVAEDGNTGQVTGPVHPPLVVPPCLPFSKSWSLMNSGSVAWPAGCCLRYIEGHQMSSTDRVVINVAVEPNHVYELQLLLTSPAEPGFYTSQWRMSTLTGTPFGEPLCVAVQVGDAASVPPTSTGCAEMSSVDADIADSLPGGCHSPPAVADASSQMMFSEPPPSVSMEQQAHSMDQS